MHFFYFSKVLHFLNVFIRGLPKSTLSIPANPFVFGSFRNRLCNYRACHILLWPTCATCKLGVPWNLIACCFSLRPAADNVDIGFRPHLCIFWVFSWICFTQSVMFIFSSSGHKDSQSRYPDSSRKDYAMLVALFLESSSIITEDSGTLVHVA